MFKVATFTALVLLTLGTVHGQETAFAPKFYAFQNGLRFGSFAEEAKVLKALGYDGVNQAKHTGAKLVWRLAVAGENDQAVRPHLGKEGAFAVG